MTSSFPRPLLAILMAAAGAPGCDTAAPPGTQRAPEQAVPAAFFRNVASDFDIKFINEPRNRAAYPLPAIMGSGCAVLDFDRNGLPDVLLLAQNSVGPGVALFSQDQAGRFTERSWELGLQHLSGTGVAVADANNDGWPDLYVTSTTDDSLWQNQSGQAFTEVTEAAGIENRRWGVAACWVDYDRDGWLDLFVANYVDYSDRPCTSVGGGDPDFCNPGLFDRSPDRLFRNITAESGHLAFRDVTDECGISAGLSAGLAVTAADFTDDGWIDVYVASDQYPNLLWVNQKGTFTEEASIRGCDVDFQGRSQASMGLALADVNRVPGEELIVSHLDGEAHAVYVLGPGGLCVDDSRRDAIAQRTRPFTGFGIAAVDFDLDGDPELFTVNGRVRRSAQPDGKPGQFWTPYRQPLQLLTRSSLRTTSDAVADADAVADRSARAFRSANVVRQSGGPGQHVARGLAVGDLDRDGDPDAVVSTIGEPAMVLQNVTNPRGRRLRLRVVDPLLGGRSCPGAVIKCDVDGRIQRMTFQPGQSYGSTHLDERIIALPAEFESVTIDVVWPHGDLTPERFRAAQGDRGLSTIDALLQRGCGVLLDGDDEKEHSH